MAADAGGSDSKINRHVAVAAIQNPQRIVVPANHVTRWAWPVEHMTRMLWLWMSATV